MRVLAVFGPLINLTVNLGIVVMLWLSGSRAGGEIGKLMASVNYMTQMLFALGMVSNILNVAVRAMASSERVQEILDEVPAQKDGTKILRKAKGNLVFEDVSFTYAGTSTPALKHINFEVKQGETLGIIGATGSGKSTLTHLVSRFYDATEGQILVDGQNINDFSMEELRKRIAVVPQKALLFSGTIEENLRWGDETASSKMVRAAAKAACADEFVVGFPDGYETNLGQGGVNVSGGQKQRLSIARALLKNPRILILDDSTSALDATTEAQVLNGIRDKAHGMTVLQIFLLTRTITKKTRVLFRKQQVILGKLNGQVEESISGISMVKAFGQEENMMEQFIESNEAYCEVATRANIISGFLMPITNVINNLNYVMIAIVSGVMAAKGMMTVGEISSFLLYSRQFTRPFVDIANIYNNFQTAVAGAERIFEIFDEEKEPEDCENPRTLSNIRGKVEFRDVSFGYQPDKQVLQHINLRIEAGTKVAIVGPTGSGKTTFINLLTRFYDIQEGAILLDGYDLREYRMQDLREAFGVVLQDTSLFGISIRDNISYGRENVSLAEIQKAARVAGADAFIRRLLQGYDTILTQGGGELSQGERQLLTIARAVLAKSPILILDEATSSVDTVTEQGTHGELLARNGEYAAMYRTQMGLE